MVGAMEFLERIKREFGQFLITEHLTVAEFLSGSSPKKARPKKPAPKKPGKQNLYEILGVDPRASPNDIKKAYRAKMQSLHPDKTASWATEDVPKEVKDFLTKTAKQLNLAYEVLSDPRKRREYDQRIAG